jgi:tRNA-2-methylthio-N6-dimethylallyladenosine synthase
MNRKHTISEYYKIYDQLKEINSNIQFSSDFIIGYPGEEEEDFKLLLNLLKRLSLLILILLFLVQDQEQLLQI